MSMYFVLVRMLDFVFHIHNFLCRGDGAENVSATAGSSMPGGRLLGRLQHRKSSLNQRLQELSTQSDEQQSTEDADIQSQSSEHFAGQNLRRQKSLRRRFLSDELSEVGDSKEIQSEAVIELPLGHKNGRAATHAAIKNTLALLQAEKLTNKSVSRTPDSGRSSRSPGARSLLHSRPSELPSPNRELPPLIESDETNPNADIDTMSTTTSLGASSYRSGKRRLFKRVTKVNTEADVNDFDVLLTSYRSSPDSRASLTGSHTSLSSIRSTRLANGIILAEAQDSGPEGGSSRGHSGGSRVGLPPRAPRLSGISKGANPAYTSLQQCLSQVFTV